MAGKRLSSVRHVKVLRQALTCGRYIPGQVVHGSHVLFCYVRYAGQPSLKIPHGILKILRGFNRSSAIEQLRVFRGSEVASGSEEG